MTSVCAGRVLSGVARSWYAISSIQPDSSKRPQRGPGTDYGSTPHTLGAKWHQHIRRQV
jgi:hypothetical protein